MSKFKKIALTFTPLQIILLIILISINATIAYLTVNDSKTNSFKLASYSVTPVEPDVTNPDEASWGIDSKEVYIKNNGTGDGYVRARIVVTVTGKNGSGYILGSENLGETAEPIANRSINGDFILNYDSEWSTNWLFKDGWFYLKNQLIAGDTSEMLLSGVTLNTSDPLTEAQLKEKYADCLIKVTVLCDIAQPEVATTSWGLTINASDEVTG